MTGAPGPGSGGPINKKVAAAAGALGLGLGALSMVVGDKAPPVEAPAVHGPAKAGTPNAESLMDAAKKINLSRDTMDAIERNGFSFHLRTENGAEFLDVKHPSQAGYEGKVVSFGLGNSEIVKSAIEEIKGVKRVKLDWFVKTGDGSKMPVSFIF